MWLQAKHSDTLGAPHAGRGHRPTLAKVRHPGSFQPRTGNIDSGTFIEGKIEECQHRIQDHSDPGPTRSPTAMSLPFADLGCGGLIDFSAQGFRMSRWSLPLPSRTFATARHAEVLDRKKETLPRNNKNPQARRWNQTVRHCTSLKPRSLVIAVMVRFLDPRETIQNPEGHLLVRLSDMERLGIRKRMPLALPCRKFSANSISCRLRLVSRPRKPSLCRL